MSIPGRLQDKAPAPVYLAGSLMVILIAAAAVWMVAGDRRAAVANAKQHLDDFTVVVAEQTGFALHKAPADILVALNTERPKSGTPVADEAFQRYLAALYGGLELRERARTLGGDARIYSPAEGGTIVEIDIPLQPRPVAGAAR